ncbi:NAD(P)-bd-dom domain-containing protein [Mycena indigotica]|uniref:NAD(P)-bd-dom domain-containing protein n=1 Tax=Mycena indigotica TaxID=2126181 RepID=A0A8H6SGK9_9AGAR|nr:NAD(P)-bd-dom domain-containing protein [Mycena indigotica]KAF7297460.1 NAD(P)-bd-dom domain-containing protein [Mycena indigotica]
MAGKNVVIVGGHGNVSLRLTRLLTPAHTVTSLIRTTEHNADIVAAGSKPLLLSLEGATVEQLASTLSAANADVVYFSAGAGGKGGEERTKSVDYEGALKVFDAIESLAEGSRPRLILVSALDVRDPEKVPAHYSEEDIALSTRIRGHIPAYMKWKYEADKNLAQRKGFKWTILRPGGLTNTAGTGTASIGRTHLSPQISRDDVALTLFHLIDREDAAGLAIDIVGGEMAVAEGLDKMIAKGETDFLG